MVLLTTPLIALPNPVGRVALKNMFALLGPSFLVRVWKL